MQRTAQAGFYRSWVACYGVSNRVNCAGGVGFLSVGCFCVVSRFFASAQRAAADWRRYID